MLLRSLPFMSRPHAYLEFRVWTLMAVPMGILTGGVAGVTVNTLFEGTASTWILALAVAIATGAGSLANLFSMAWSHWSLGRDKVAALTRLQSGLGVCLLVIACLPRSTLGLGPLVACVVLAQVLWCGIITIRASVWRLNYTRIARTEFAARNQILVSICGASVGAASGLALDMDVDAFRWLFGIAAGFVFTSLTLLQRLRVRRHGRLLAAERRSASRFRLSRFVSILRDDKLYRSYMTWMMVFGAGNIMITAPLILVLTDHFAVTRFTQVLITASVPTLLMPISTPFWAGILSRQHVIRFRMINSRVYVAAMLAHLAGGMLGILPLLWLGAILQGSAIGGGALGWNLGHNDFAPDERVAEYLGLHVTLTGLRGLLAPLIGVTLYGALERWQPGSGPWALALPCLLTTTGAIGFHRMSRRSSDQQSALLP